MTASVEATARLFRCICLLIAIAGLGPAAAEGGGHWIFSHFKERMDCVYDAAESDLWNGLADFLFQPESPQNSLTIRDDPSRLIALNTKLWAILLPFGVTDPAVALSCSLGTSAALYELASLCINVHGDLCLQRALRLTHLSKLFALFNFNDFGAWFSQSRWRIDMNELSSAMLELTRLSRADPGVTSPMLEPLHFRDDRWKIGLVTYCHYNDSRTKLTSQSRSNKMAYASQHSYKLLHFEEPFMTQAHPWMNKLIAIQRNLAAFDWLFWVDCDLFFMNPERTVDSFVQTALRKHPDASLVIAEDGMMLNSGAFLLRNSPWGINFLAQTVDLLSAPMPHSFQHMPWHEQAPLIYLSLNPGVLSGLGGPGGATPAGTALSTGYDPSVVLLPQRALNSYPPEVVQKTGHVLPHESYEDGDFVVSFNGCGSVLGGEYCEAMYERYHALSMDHFHHARQQADS